MNWVTLVVLSTVVSAGCNILDKRLRDRRTVPPPAAAASFGVVGLPVALVGLLFVPPVPWPEAWRGLAGGMLFVAAAWLYYDALAWEEASRLIPLLQLTTVQTLLMGWVLLGERLSGREWIAFGAMAVGGGLLAFKPGERGLTLSRGALRMLLVTTLLAADQVLTAPVYRNAGLWAGVVWENVGVVLGSGLLVWRWAREGAAASWAGVDRKAGGVLVLEQVTRLVTGLAPAWAVAQGVPLALVSAAAGVRLAWIWVLAMVVLGERGGRRDLLCKGAGIVGIGLGVYGLSGA